MEDKQAPLLHKCTHALLHCLAFCCFCHSSLLASQMKHKTYAKEMHIQMLFFFLIFFCKMFMHKEETTRHECDLLLFMFQIYRDVFFRFFCQLTIFYFFKFILQHKFYVVHIISVAHVSQKSLKIIFFLEKPSITIAHT